MRLTNFVVSLPLLLCAAQLAQPVASAQAAGMDASAAAGLLAKSNAIDVKCNILSADQSQDLKDFVARAEISLAETASVAVARKAIASGKAEGKSAICDDAAKRLVNDVLAAANAATSAQIDDQTASAVPEPQTLVAVPTTPMASTMKPEENAVAVVEQESTPKPLKTVKLVKPQKPVAKVKVAKIIKPATAAKAAKPANGLKTYASVAEKYYVASRCGTMTRSEINSLYKQVLANHQQALAGNRPRAVRSMLQSAEARAGAKACS